LFAVVAVVAAATDSGENASEATLRQLVVSWSCVAFPPWPATLVQTQIATSDVCGEADN